LATDAEHVSMAVHAQRLGLPELHEVHDMLSERIKQWPERWEEKGRQEGRQPL
jgi:hypothetical protein